MRRGILGGTFDPPHMAHLLAGETAYREGRLDVVTFIPAGAPWQKQDRRVSAPGDRLAMIRLATEPVSYFQVDDCEVVRGGWSYTADTLAGYPPGEDLILVLGADAARGLPTWERADEVIARVEVAVVPRPGVEPASVEEALDGVSHRWLDLPELEISGTMLRTRAAGGDSIRFLVPDPVWRYAGEHRLYDPAGGRVGAGGATP